MGPFRTGLVLVLNVVELSGATGPDANALGIAVFKAIVDEAGFAVAMLVTRGIQRVVVSMDAVPVGTGIAVLS